MAELFVLELIGFWALFLLSAVAIFILSHYEKGFFIFLTLAAFVGATFFFGFAETLSAVTLNPIIILYVVVSYIVLSVPWGVFRWYIFCQDELQKYKDLKTRFLKIRGVKDTTIIPDEYKSEWKEEISRTRSYGGRSIADPPLVYEHKGHIIRSMSFWVIDAVWFLVGDLFVRLWKRIYHLISDTLQTMANSIFSSKIKDDLN